MGISEIRNRAAELAINPGSADNFYTSQNGLPSSTAPNNNVLQQKMTFLYEARKQLENPIEVMIPRLLELVDTDLEGGELTDRAAGANTIKLEDPQPSKDFTQKTTKTQSGSVSKQQ